MKYNGIIYILIISACSYDDPDICEDENPSFTTCVSPIIQENCVSCHSYSGSAGSTLNLDNYDAIKHATLEGNLIERINSIENPMPPSGRMSHSSIDIIEKWKLNGSPNN